MLKNTSILVLALVAQGSVTSAQSVPGCLSRWSDPAGAQDCASVLALARCFALAGVDEMDSLDTLRQSAEQFLLEKQRDQPACADAAEDEAPKMRTARGDVEFEVSEGNDVRAFRFRRETVSLFDVSSRLQTVEGLTTGIPTTVSAAMATMSTQVAAQLVAARTQTNDLLSTQQSAMVATLADARAEVATLSAAVATQSAAVGLFSTAINALSVNMTAVQGRSQGLLVGHTECTHRGANNADSPRVVMRCSFVKKRSDTILVLSHNAVMRQINGYSYWRLEVDNQPCRTATGSDEGDLQISFHGSQSVNLHRPMMLRGTCPRTTSQARINAGTHSLSFKQYQVSSDSYWGWDSSARLMVEEYMPNSA
jgi:hypothetical protein